MFSKLANGLSEIDSFALRDFPDKRPIEWWEHLLFILLIPYCLVAGAGAMLWFLFAKPSERDRKYTEHSNKRTLENNKIRDVLRNKNRFLTCQELLARDPERKGTILSDPHQGLTWWTEDDVLALAPAECEYTRAVQRFDHPSIDQARDHYARQCCEHYYDLESGKAYLLRWSEAEANLINDWLPQRNICLSHSVYEELNTEVYLIWSCFDTSSQFDSDATEAAEAVNQSIPASSPYLSRTMLKGFVCCIFLIGIPSLMSVWEVPFLTWLAIPLFLFWVNLIAGVAWMFRRQNEVSSNEFDFNRWPYFALGIGSIIFLFSSLSLIIAAIDYPSVWSTIVANIILFTGLWCFGHVVLPKASVDTE